MNFNLILLKIKTLLQSSLEGLVCPPFVLFPWMHWSVLGLSYSAEQDKTVDLKAFVYWNNTMCLWNINAPDNGQFHRWPRSPGKISWYQKEDLVTRMLMCNMKALVLSVQKLKARFKFSNSKVKVTVSKIMVPTRNNHLKYQSSSTHCSKDISKVKVSKMGHTPSPRSQGKK